MSIENKAKVNEKHLEFITTTIERMAQNSFQIKAWCITITSALAAFCVAQNEVGKQNCMGLFLLGMTISFGFTDAYYLCLERGFRKLYEMAVHRDGAEDFYEFDMRIPKKARGIKNYCKCLTSPSITLFYGTIIVCLIALQIFIN